MNPKEKLESTQNEQAPQDENPMSSPKKSDRNSGKTLNDVNEAKRKRDKQKKEKSNNT
jgi:hypothetical protein